MNKYQEAQKYIMNTFNKIALGSNDYSSKKVAESCFTLQELVNKETPSKVEYEADGYADGYPVNYPICPHCNIDLEDYMEVNHCPKCGQRLDWSKE